MSDSLTIGRLAKAAGLSRSTLLYYDRLGLLRPVNRSLGNYRLYSPDDVDRLRQICRYREMGIPLAEIARMFDENGREHSHSEAVLSRHLAFLGEQIAELRKQQRQVVNLLQEIASRSSACASGRKRARRQTSKSTGRNKNLQKENEMVNKDRWVEIMKAAGFSEDDMNNWHRQFERLEPDAHQEFLASLGIAPPEIERIREHSRA